MSKIEWTEATWNPIVGCSITSPGCTNCYAMKMAGRIERMGTAPHYDGTTRASKAGGVWTGKLALAPEHVLMAPLRRRKPTTWFVNSMGDLFHEDVPDAWIDRVFAVMALSPQHSFQVLTKRAARMRAYVSDPTTVGRIYDIVCDLSLEEAANVILLARPEHAAHAPPGRKILLGRWPLPNVWLGVSAEDQDRADERVPELLATPAAVRFVSAEPLLGPIDFRDLTVPQKVGTWQVNALFCDCPPDEDTELGGATLDWIIVGGESGPGARPMHPDWERHIREDCAAAGVAYFRKQWGAWKACASNDGEWPVDVPGFIRLRANGTRGPDGWPMQLVGKKAAGRLLDGVEHSAMPLARRNIDAEG